MKKMKKRRFTAFLLTFILLTASLAACHTKKKQEEMEEKTLSDDLYSYQVSIDGHVYSLPCPVSEFEEHGWAIYNDSDPAVEFLASGETNEQCYLKKGKERIPVDLYNAHAEKAPLSYSTVVMMRIHASDGIETILPGGLSLYFDTTEEKIYSAYGEPVERVEGTNTVQYDYNKSYNKMIEFRLFIPGKTNPYSNNYFYIANREVPDDQAILYRSKVGKVAIVDELESCQVCVDGHVFTDPFSFEEWEENGWLFVGHDLDRLLAPNDIHNMTEFNKGDMTIQLGLRNTSEEERLPRNCAITTVKLELLFGVNYYILPGNFFFDRFTTIQDIIDQYGQPDESTEWKNYIGMTYLSKTGSQNSIEFVIARVDSGKSPLYSSVNLKRNVE